jgi:hypothetical protein
MNTQDFVTDDEVDEMFGGDEAPPQQQRQALPQPVVQQGVQPIGNINGLPVYPLALAQVPPVVGAPVVGDFLTRKYGPLPVWGWALTALGTGLGGYFIWHTTQKKVSKNDGGEDDSEDDETSEGGGEGRGSWGPSRSAFTDQLNKYFSRKAVKAQVFHDADDAKKKLKIVSPLINVKFDVAYKPDRDLVRLCKREGLKPTVHEDGTIGLYPVQANKRGREWEKYIDLLRDDGQTV